jgi:hypothetical protein
MKHMSGLPANGPICIGPHLSDLDLSGGVRSTCLDSTLQVFSVGAFIVIAVAIPALPEA